VQQRCGLFCVSAIEAAKIIDSLSFDVNNAEHRSRNSPTMKRLLLILLLIALPFQMSWASAARYCQHEQDRSTQHFGHHEHHHVADKEATKEQSSAKSLAVDTDCGTCQLNVTAITTIQANNLSVYPPQIASTFATINFIISLRPVRPERPKWVRAA
jgi:hypothetical protein